jgi:hypothetical protein
MAAGYLACSDDINYFNICETSPVESSNILLAEQ